jgi:hypothetical protein
MIASALAGGRRRRGLLRANSVFLNRSPSRRRNSQTALTLTPRAASSSFRRATSDAASGRAAP